MDILTIKFACLAAHLKEYIDTDSVIDMAAAQGILNEPEVQEWIKRNEVMLPVRRDGAPAL